MRSQDHVAFDRKSRELFIIASVVLVLYLVLFFFAAIAWS